MTRPDTDTTLSIPEEVAAHPAWFRMEDQLNWYDSRSVLFQARYKQLKVVQIGLAVVIPIIAPLDTGVSGWAAAMAGALIALLEGVQHLYQYSTLWVQYRSTAEQIKHEKWLFLSAAGRYRERPTETRLVLLAERLEELISTENARWVDDTRQSAKEKAPEPRT